MYKHCVGISGAIAVWTALVKLHLSSQDPNVQWNCLRHMHAAAHIQYYTLQGEALTEEEMCVIQGRDSTVKVPPWQWLSSVSAPPQGVPGSSRHSLRLAGHPWL